MNMRYGSIAQLGEHLPYKQRVIGSIPIVPTIHGGIPEWLKGADCKSVIYDFDGSNPSSSTTKITCLITCWHGSTVEQLICNQQVVGSIPIASSIMGEFPSG